MNQPRVPADPTQAMAHGGTFVRPGAFAWGRPGEPDGAGSAVIEDALAAAVKDQDRITDLLDELRQARLWVPLPDEGGPVTDGSAVHLPTVTYLGAEFVPAFTSAERLTSWRLTGMVPAQSPAAGGQGDGSARGRQGGILPHIVVPAAELARRLPQGMGIALNPGAEASVPIYPGGIGYLAAVVTGQVMVGHPPADPVALLGEVRASLRSVPAVQRASRAWLSVPGQGEGLVISVALRDPVDASAHQAVIEAIERAAAAVPHRFPIDVTFPGEAEPDQVDEWISGYAEPFYVRALSPGQMLKPRARSCSRPSSVMLSGPHGGIHTQLIRKSATTPSSASRAWSSITSVSGHAALVSVMSMVAIRSPSTLTP
jgi:hypothetical protein